MELKRMDIDSERERRRERQREIVRQRERERGEREIVVDTYYRFDSTYSQEVLPQRVEFRICLAFHLRWDTQRPRNSQKSRPDEGTSIVCRGAGGGHIGDDDVIW